MAEYTAAGDSGIARSRRAAGPLDDIQVVDLTTGIAGPYCTKLFADAGADVVKVEPAGGDPTRRHVLSGAPVGPEGGPLFRHLNGGKQSVVGDLDDALVASLLGGADLLVEDGVEGLALDRVRQLHPHLIVLSITSFGRSGPLSGSPASDLTVQAESGAMKFRGRPDRPPVQAGGRISEFLGGAAAAAPALAAVLRSRRSGVGDHIDVSCHDVMAIAGSNYMDLLDSLMGRPTAQGPLRILDTPGIESTADGEVGLNANTGRMFEMFLLLIERPDLLVDPEMARLRHRIAMGDDWQQIVDGWMRMHTTAEVVAAAAELRVPVAPVHDGRSVMADEQYTARDMFERQVDGSVRIRAPYLVDGARPLIRRAPRLDEHRSQLNPRPARPLHEPPPLDALPLEGVKVIDHTSWWVGGMATQVLGLLGADVIHVESASHPDGMRLTGAWSEAEDWWEYGHMFTAASAGKRGVTLDLSSDEGRERLLHLVAGADMYVENFSPRVTESFGFDFAGVRAANPTIVHLRMPAFGLTGPWRDRPAFAQIIEPMATMAAITGFPGDRPVAKGGLPDPTAAWHGAFVALVGLAQRERTGHAVALESVMAEAAINVCPEPVIEWASAGHLVERTGNRSPHAIFQQVVPCRGADEWLAVSVLDERQAVSLLALLPEGSLDRHGLGQPDVADPVVAAWSAGKDAELAARMLRAAGVPAARCQDPRTLAAHPHLIARGLFEVVDHPVLGTHPTPALPCRFASVERWIDRPAPTLGQHNAEVLELGPAEYERLVAAGVIGSRPPGL